MFAANVPTWFSSVDLCSHVSPATPSPATLPPTTPAPVDTPAPTPIPTMRGKTDEYRPFMCRRARKLLTNFQSMLCPYLMLPHA